MTPAGIPETEEELKSCLENPWWRLNNLYSIKPPSGGVIKFRPNVVQRRIYQEYWWQNNILKSRQHGVSTFWVVFYNDRLLFEPDKTAGVIDITADDAKKKLGMAKTAYDHMDDPDVHPDTWQIGAMVKDEVKMEKGRDAPFPQEIVYSNGSSFYAGVSFRGGTLQYGLFTEFGKIAVKDPSKAAEIVEGAENAMHEGSIATFETTHEGGQTGLAYERCEVAMNNPRDKAQLTRLDPLFLFYGWYEDPKNALNKEQTTITMSKLNSSDYIDTRNGSFNWREYFYGDEDKNPGAIARLERERGVEISYAQIAWYVKKRVSQGWAMLKEHPTFPEEAFQAPITGAIYAEQMLRAEVEERVSKFQPHKGKLVHTTWDIGSNANTVVVYWQKVGTEWRAIDCDHDLDMTVGERVGHMLRKNYNYGVHALPHDCLHQKIGDITMKGVLQDAGLKNIKAIPVTASVSLRIDGMWGMMPNIRFSELTTERLRLALKQYRYKQDEKGKWITDIIVKDWTNHYADAFGYLWEADQASLFMDSIDAGHGPSVRSVPVSASGMGGGVSRGVIHAGGL